MPGAHSSKAMSSNSRLTKAQEIFVQELVKGETQRKAYLKAYPSKKKWKDNSVDCKASLLFKQEKIVKWYDQLMNQFREEEQNNTRWSREESIKTLKYVINKNVDDMERIQKASEEELEALAEQIKLQPESAFLLIQHMLKQKKIRRLSGVHNQGIVSAVAELNKMQGFNEETINLNGTVVFEGEEELPE